MEIWSYALLLVDMIHQEFSWLMISHDVDSEVL